MLCNVCESLHISPGDFVINPNEDNARFEPFHNLGSVDAVLERSGYCPLCRLVVEAWGGLPNLLRKNLDYELYWQSDGFVTGNEQPTVRCLRVLVRGGPKSSKYYNELGRIILLGHDTPNGDGLFFGRRIPEKQIDIKRIKRWMNLCQLWHGDDCEECFDEAEGHYPSTFRVIDTFDRCIVCPPSPCKYLTLSYTWGRDKVFELTSNNLSDLKTIKALDGVWQELPKTIQDAITLTSTLGIRYVWVDSLCIIQDSDEDKPSMFPFMHKVYNHAFMTIIAGSGSDADAGLPGVRAYSRDQLQRVEEIRPGMRLLCPQHVSDAMDHSFYASRGWTFQEETLSRRHLIFVNGTVSFHCRREAWREDVKLESIRAQNYFDLQGKHYFVIKSAGSPHSDYLASLYQYSQRELTYNNDVLNAFAGISALVAKRTNAKRTTRVDHVYGLPAPYFDWAILWSNDTSQRRQGAWPSWSWCGWTGGVTSMVFANLETQDLDDWLRNHTWIRWIVYGQNGLPILQIPSDDTYQHGEIPLPSRNYTPVVAASVAEVKAIVEFTTPITDANGCLPLLHFATLLVHLDIIPSDYPATWGDELEVRSYHICDASGARCGQISLPINTFSRLDKLYKFIIMSETRRHTALSREQALSDNGPSIDWKDWSAYHVILIKWLDENKGIAERVAIGAVYQEAINEMVGQGAEWREIWLR